MHGAGDECAIVPNEVYHAGVILGYLGSEALAGGGHIIIRFGSRIKGREGLTDSVASNHYT